MAKPKVHIGKAALHKDKKKHRKKVTPLGAPKWQTITRPPLNMINIYASNGTVVTAYLDSSVPQLSGRQGGWTVVPRLGRTSVIEYDGQAPLSLSFGCIIDSKGFNQDVNDDFWALVAMAAERKGRDDNSPLPPPQIRLQGNVPHHSKTWVIDTDGLQWGDRITDNHSYHHKQLWFTLKLLEYANDFGVVTTGLKTPARNAAGKIKTRKYVVKNSDMSWRQIAKDQLHNAAYASTIIKINGVSKASRPKHKKTILLPVF